MVRRPFLYPFIFLTCFVSACNEMSKTTHPETLPLPQSVQEFQSPFEPYLNFFHAICLKSKGEVSFMQDRATEYQFSIASDQNLLDLGLPNIRKRTLLIPGGGAHISETQKVSVNQDQQTVLVTEEQFAKSDLVKSQCIIYTPFLKSIQPCVSLGFMINHSPVKNVRNIADNSHILTWQGHAHGIRLLISCEWRSKSKDASTPFYGIIFKASFLHKVKLATQIAGKSKK